MTTEDDADDDDDDKKERHRCELFLWKVFQTIATH